MMAAVEARRAQRRALESGAPRAPPAAPAPPEDAAARNLATLSGREGVGGVFQVLRIGTRSGEFAFNGWRPSGRNQWREVIEVDAGLHGNVQLAMIRRMIELIRTHYTGDFHWESHRLGRVVPLSARPEDNEGLEDFMMKEFFGQPVINPRSSRFRTPRSSGGTAPGPGGILPHLPLERREPAQQLSRGPERLCGPRPERKAVVVAHDEPVAEGEHRRDAVHDRAAGAVKV
jgi:hypothetical protein